MLFLRSFILKPTDRKYVLLKTALAVFKIALCLRDRHVFMRQSVESLRQIFWKTKKIFEKLEYSFLVETAKIENASFPYKTAISDK